MRAVSVRWPDATLSLLVRERARAERIGLPAASLIEGRFDATLAPRGVFAGVDVAVHLAGAVKARASDELMQSNAAGTAHLLAALPPQARVVLVSSLAAAGPSRDGAGTDVPPDVCRPCSVYGESKRQGELALLADAARTGRPWLVLRPCLVYGPGDGATRLLVKQARAPLCFVPWRARPLSTIHVSDVTAALVAAIERTDARGAFLPVAGEATDTHALLRAIAEASGQRARLVRIPDALAALAGRTADVVARVRGTASYFSRDKVREILAPGWVANREPARAVLGFEAKLGLAEGLLRSALG